MVFEAEFVDDKQSQCLAEAIPGSKQTPSTNRSWSG